jgi:hypothetical protein
MKNHGVYTCASHNKQMFVVRRDDSVDFPAIHNIDETRKANPNMLFPCDCSDFIYRFTLGDKVILDNTEWFIQDAVALYDHIELKDTSDCIVQRDSIQTGCNVVLIRDELVMIEIPLKEFLQKLERK